MNFEELIKRLRNNKITIRCKQPNGIITEPYNCKKPLPTPSYGEQITITYIPSKNKYLVFTKDGNKEYTEEELKNLYISKEIEKWKCITD
jgi:hypothetical protein